MNKISLIIIHVISIIIIAGAFFYGGIAYQKSQTSKPSAFGQQNAQSFGGRQNRNGVAGGGFISGSILSKDASSITVQLPNNAGTKIIFYSTATKIIKTVQGTTDDLTNGTNVSVTGATNSDGTVTAENIQIRPAGQSPRPIN